MNIRTSILAIALSIFATAPLQAQATSISIDLDNFQVFNSCNGHLLKMTGRLHIVTHMRALQGGGILMKSHAQPQDLMGVDTTTGAKYIAVGVTSFSTVNLAGLGSTATIVSRFLMIGASKGAPSMLVKVTNHVTVNANGTTTVSISKFEVTCAGK